MKPEWQILAVGIGGALGALSRFGIHLLMNRLLGASFPVGTLISNVTGCFLIGVLIGSGKAESNQVALFGFGVGFLGGLTTFSTFAAETIQHVHEGQWSIALANVATNLIIGFVAVVLGMAAGTKYFS